MREDFAEVRRTSYWPENEKGRCNFALFFAGMQDWGFINSVVHIGFSDFAGLSVNRCVKQAMLAVLSNEMWHFLCTLTCIEYICSALASLCHSLTHCVHTVYNWHQRNAKSFWICFILHYGIFFARFIYQIKRRKSTQSVNLLLLSQLYRMPERSE